MIRTIVALFILLAGFCVSQSAAALTCEPAPERHVQRVDGEVVGQRAFRQSVGSGWTFALMPARYGWDLRLFDQNGLDLSQITPPYRQAPNPRQLYGWHFRNTANTGANKGDVNAPQHTRLFQFSPALIGTGGFKPSAPNPSLDNAEGRGVLTVVDMGLADLEPGQQARMNYLKFETCLSWPKTEDEIRAQQDAASPAFVEEEMEIIFGCGLDASKYHLSAWTMPRWLSGDLDGDDAFDYVAPIIRHSDQRKGIAICRAGAYLSIVGYTEAEQRPLKPSYYTLAEYLDKVEFWELRRNDWGRYEVVMGQTEKSEVAVTWGPTGFSHRLLWHFVEP